MSRRILLSRSTLFPPQADFPPWVHTAGTVLQWLGYSNSFVNPFLYTAFNSEFRTAFKALFRKVACAK